MRPCAEAGSTLHNVVGVAGPQPPGPPRVGGAVVPTTRRAPPPPSPLSVIISGNGLAAPHNQRRDVDHAAPVADHGARTTHPPALPPACRVRCVTGRAPPCHLCCTRSVTGVSARVFTHVLDTAPRRHYDNAPLLFGGEGRKGLPDTPRPVAPARGVRRGRCPCRGLSVPIKAHPSAAAEWACALFILSVRPPTGRGTQSPSHPLHARPLFPFPEASHPHPKHHGTCSHARGRLAHKRRCPGGHLRGHPRWRCGSRRR